MKIKFLFLLFIFALFTCTVNETTGLLRVTNETSDTFTDIKIGGTYLSPFLFGNLNVDYWYYFPIAGQLTFTRYDDFMDFTSNASFNFDLDEYHKITIREGIGDSYIITLE